MKGVSMIDKEGREHNKHARKTEGPRLLQFGKKVVNKVKDKFSEIKEKVKSNKEEKERSQNAYNKMKEKGLLKYGDK
jgi:gas vesicle protein